MRKKIFNNPRFHPVSLPPNHRCGRPIGGTPQPGIPHPSPSPIIEEFEFADEVRQIHCAKYNDCLRLSVDKEWTGFSCKDCLAFTQMSEDEERSDLEGIVEMFEHATRTFADYKNIGALDDELEEEDEDTEEQA